MLDDWMNYHTASVMWNKYLPLCFYAGILLGFQGLGFLLFVVSTHFLPASVSRFFLIRRGSRIIQGFAGMLLWQLVAKFNRSHSINERKETSLTWDSFRFAGNIWNMKLSREPFYTASVRSVKWNKYFIHFFDPPFSWILSRFAGILWETIKSCVQLFRNDSN